MESMKKIWLAALLLIPIMVGTGQIDSLNYETDSLYSEKMNELSLKLKELENLRLAESSEKAKLQVQLEELSTSEKRKNAELLQRLEDIDNEQKQRLYTQKARIDSLRTVATGYPVKGRLQDTLFYIYNRVGAFSPAQRALSISKRIELIAEADRFFTDSLKVVKAENGFDIVYDDLVIVTISDVDALWEGTTAKLLSDRLSVTIQDSIVKARKETSWIKIQIRIGLMLLVFGVAWGAVWGIGKGYKKLTLFISNSRWLKDLRYKDYTFLTAEQELKVILLLVRFSKWFLFILLGYTTLPIVFSIFPFSRDWADVLFKLIWSPFRGILVAVWNYLPNLFSILAIYFVMKYFIRFVKYIFLEIRSEKLKLSGFHADWAMPTYSIVRFLLYAFMFIMIFDYLPGSDSNIFQGVSVFLGILFSLGSTSAIANMVAGLVITYMRPFKIHDFIMVGEVKGHVLEKTLLVTRIKTPKNEVVTIPNSSVLSGNTVNYSTESAAGQGLIINTTATIGYDVPWKDVHQALIDAALQTPMLEKEPLPFVWQTSLDDFYVAYQLNAYTKHSGQQGHIYSELHQNIQDVFNQRGIEIMSPHYRAHRDGNTTTIPKDYHPADYQAPTFHVNVNKEKE